MWAGCQPAAGLPPTPRKGTGLQGLGGLLIELGDIGLPEPDPRAQSGAPGPSPVAPEEERAREIGRVLLVESFLQCDPGLVTPSQGPSFPP